MNLSERITTDFDTVNFPCNIFRRPGNCEQVEAFRCIEAKFMQGLAFGRSIFLDRGITFAGNDVGLPHRTALTENFDINFVPRFFILHPGIVVVKEHGAHGTRNRDHLHASFVTAILELFHTGKFSTVVDILSRARHGSISRFGNRSAGGAKTCIHRSGRINRSFKDICTRDRIRARSYCRVSTRINGRVDHRVRSGVSSRIDDRICCRVSGRINDRSDSWIGCRINCNRSRSSIRRDRGFDLGSGRAAAIVTGGEQAKRDNREKEFRFHSVPRFFVYKYTPFFGRVVGTETQFNHICTNSTKRTAKIHP